jgi:hypothetical protein
MKNQKKLFLTCALAITFSLASYSADAIAVYIESGSYIDASGCVHITYNVQHRFLGINWYNTQEDVTAICPE